MRKKQTQIFIVVLLCLLLGGLSSCRRQQKRKADPPIPVEVGKVVRGDLPEMYKFTGDVEGEIEVKVYGTVPDRIRRMKVDVGDIVKKGQVIAIIEHTRLRQAVAQVRAQIAATQAQLAGARVGLAGAKVAMQSAKREYYRLRRLMKGGAVGSQQVDLARTQYDGARTKVAAAQAQIRALRSQITALRAGLGQANTARRNAIVRAPIAGIVGRRFRNTGDMSTPQVPLVTLVQMDQVKVQVNLTETQLGNVHLGQEAQITVAAYPQKKFTGKVTKVAPTLDLETRTAPAEITIPNVTPLAQKVTCKKDKDCTNHGGNACVKKRCVKKHLLKPGMIARVSILVRVHQNATLIPLKAILNNSFGYTAAVDRKDLAVLVLNGTSTPQRRKIRIGLEGPNETVQVLAGLKPGEKIIVTGHNMYKDGSKIRIIQSKN